MKEGIIFWLHDWGLKVGLTINTIVLVWDIPAMLSRGFFEPSIRGRGMLVFVIGMVLCWTGRYSTKWLDHKTTR